MLLYVVFYEYIALSHAFINNSRLSFVSKSVVFFDKRVLGCNLYMDTI